MKARTRVSRRLHLEELEGRWVPSSLTSTNWSGYAVSANRGSVTSVVGSWVVPTVSGTGTAYSSTWVGIDGFSSSTVEQIGTDSDVYNGVPQYYAWFEMYPNPSYTLSLAIHPGDTITASVSYANSRFTLQIADTTDGQSASLNRYASHAQRSSAEWIEEAPSSYYGPLPLANFGSVTFSGARATIGGTTGPIDNSTWANKAYPINMVSSSGATVAATGPLTDSGTPKSSSFTVTYVATSASTMKGTAPLRQPDLALPAPSSAAPSTTSASSALASEALRLAGTQTTVPTSVAAAILSGSAFTHAGPAVGVAPPSLSPASGSSFSQAGPAPTGGVPSAVALVGGAGDQADLTLTPPASDRGTPAGPTGPGALPASPVPATPRPPEQPEENGAAAEAWGSDAGGLLGQGEEGQGDEHVQDLVFALALGGAWGIAREYKSERHRRQDPS